MQNVPENLLKSLPSIQYRLGISNIIYEMEPWICPLCGKRRNENFVICWECSNKYGEDGEWVVYCELAKHDRNIFDGEPKMPPLFFNLAFEEARRECIGNDIRSLDDLVARIKKIGQFNRIPERLLIEPAKQAYGTHCQERKASSLIIEPKTTKATLPTPKESGYQKEPREETTQDCEIHIPSVFCFVEPEEIKKLVKYGEKELKIRCSSARLISTYRIPEILEGCRPAILVMYTGSEDSAKFALCYVHEKRRKRRLPGDMTPHLTFVHPIRLGEGHRKVVDCLPSLFRNILEKTEKEI